MLRKHPPRIFGYPLSSDGQLQGESVTAVELRHTSKMEALSRTPPYKHCMVPGHLATLVLPCGLFSFIWPLGFTIQD